LLKRLNSIYSWRGRLVDQVISTYIVPRINKHEQITQSDVMHYANMMMEAQLKFAKQKMYRNENSKPGSYDYCALSELENGSSLTEEQLQSVSKEVESSLQSLLGSSLLSQISEGDPYLIAQRSIQFPFAEMTVRCTPDLIVFQESNVPTIIDWKTDTFGHKEHWLQLGIYGVALSRVIPHKDFPKTCALADPTKIKLVECQLLRNQTAEYTLTEEDIADIEDYIYSSSFSMQELTSGKEPEDLISSLPKAKSPEVCISCKFKRTCWEIV
jgi:hypothetical protein